MSTLIVHDTPLKSGHHLNILDAVFRAFNEPYEIVSVLPHMPEKVLKKIKPERWLEESDRILAETKKHKKVLCAGGIAAATVFRSPKTIPVTKVRGRSFTTETKKYCIATFSPSTVVKDTDFFRDLVFDVEKLVTHDKPIPQPELEIVMVETRKDLTLLKDLHDASFLGCDTETTSLNPYEADILGIGFAALQDNNDGYIIVVPQDLIGREVKSFLYQYQGTQVWHNLLYDFQPIWKKWGEFIPKGTLADTMLMNWALDERPFNRYKNHGLDLLQRLYLDAPPKSVKMVDWLEEYYREDCGEDVRREWVHTFCEEHPEMARTAWREVFKEINGEEPDWRGRKVGRDIPISDVFEAVLQKRAPKTLWYPPTEERKVEMWDDMMRYMGEDCYSTARLYPILREKMDSESPLLWKAHQQFDVPASLAFASMRIHGAPVNIRYLKKMKKELEADLTEEMEDIRAVVTEHTNHPKGPEFNPNSSKQVAEVLYNAGDEGGLGLRQPKGVGRYAYKRSEDTVTTNSDTLKVLARQVAKDRPAVSNLINTILKYRVRSKILGTYVDGILVRVDPDGRVRGDFNLHGTATARISSSNPNLQNIPDSSHVGYDVRSAYIAPPGWILLDADMSQLELRIAALFSQDEVMLDAYRQGADIHQEVAYLLWKKPKSQITKYERYLAKCMNFGVIYGRGARSIATGPEMDNLVEMSGRSWTNKEIDNYFAKFKVGYKQLFDWMDLVKEDSMRRRYVQQPTGHMRRFDLILDSEKGHILRQMVNTPIQGFAARMVVNALVSLWRKFDPSKQQILFTVHDSIVCMCRNNKTCIAETTKLIKDTMENDLPEVTMTLPTLPHSPFTQGDRLDYNLPFVADVAIGPNWGECHDEAESLVVVAPEDLQDATYA